MGWNHIHTALNSAFAREALCIAVAFVLFFSTGFTVYHRTTFGLIEIAQYLQRPGFEKSTVLVAARAVIEGVTVSEIAMRDTRPGHTVVRASKAVGSSDWDGSNYRARLNTPAELMAYLQSVPVDFIVLDLIQPDAGAIKPHALMLEALAAYPQNFQSLGVYPTNRRSGDTAQVKLYRAIGRSPLSAAPASSQ